MTPSAIRKRAEEIYWERAATMESIVEGLVEVAREAREEVIRECAEIFPGNTPSLIREKILALLPKKEEKI